MRDPELAPGTRRADRLLVLAIAGLAGLLGCYELFDTDVWWHLRAGRWILEHRGVPRLDPFSFASADRPWIDLHWGFQLALATAEALGGVPGMILLSALASATAVAIAVAARREDWPAWVVAIGWLPAIALMATRFDPRPEVFSLVFLASFLAILLRVERRPALAWALVPIQVAWVNMHGLFILGPILLGFYWLDLALRTWLDARRGTPPPDRGRPMVWRHLAPASVAVLLATLANPYGLRGAMLPLELLPKIVDPDNPYKSYIDEFAGLRSSILDRMAGAPGPHFHLRVQVFLLLTMAWSFLPTAVWRAWSRSQSRAAEWGGVLVVLLGFAVVDVLGLPLPETPAWLSATARASPAALLIAGVAAAALMAPRSRAAAITMAFGSAAAASWSAWLRTYLFDDGPMNRGAFSVTMPYVGAALGIAAAIAILRAGGSLFRMLLAAAFTYLSFQAVRNVNLFAMAAGAVLAWNLGEWSAAIAPARPHRLAIWAPRVVLLAIVAAWSLGVVTNRYYAMAGEDIRFGLRERPRTFAHEAARFAGGPGLPAHALVFHLGQSGVYLYHNGPGRKVYIDGRLEVPSLSTFRNYVRIQDQLSRNDPRWDVAVSRLGDPLILIAHEGWLEAEASLLSHPRWRCIHFDELASVFVPRRGPSSSPGVPDFDFGAVPAAGTAMTSEAGTLLTLATVLRRRGVDPWRVRMPILLGAAGRARAQIVRDAADPIAWRLLGLIEWEMVPDLSRPPPGPLDPWDPATGLSWARATYCLRRALEASPGDSPTIKALAACFGVRRMAEARRRIESLPRRADRPEDTFGSLEGPLGRAEGSSWSEADRIAATFLHLGNPRAARRTWGEATDPPSTALRWTRMAAADLAELDATAAESRCRQALRLDPRLGEAWCLLAVACLEAGHVDEARDACRRALECQLTDAQRERVAGVQARAGLSRADAVR